MDDSGTAEKWNTAPQGYLSGKTDGYLIAVHDDGHLLPAAGISQHFFELFRVFVDIDIDRPVAIGLTSLNAKRSGICSINNYFLHHVLLCISKASFNARTTTASAPPSLS